MNIYLDIDGVILANDKQAALHADDFIKYIVENGTVYWLTTHCRNTNDDPMPMLAKFFEEKTLTYLRKVKPAYWETLKTDGIDFSQPFLWFDDDVLHEEKKILEQHDALDAWVEVNLSEDQDELAHLIALLQQDESYDNLSPEEEALIEKVIELAIANGKVSYGSLQRDLQMSFARVARLIDIAEMRGLLEPTRYATTWLPSGKDQTR